MCVSYYGSSELDAENLCFQVFTLHPTMTIPSLGKGKFIEVLEIFLSEVLMIQGIMYDIKRSIQRPC